MALLVRTQSGVPPRTESRCVMEHIVEVIVSVSAVLISTIAIWVGKTMYKKAKYKAERISDMDKKIDKITEALVDITELVKVLEPVKSGQLAILRYSLSRLYECHKECGEVTQAELDEFLDMYKPYTELGGNGTVASMVSYIKKLPIVKEHKEKSK